MRLRIAARRAESRAGGAAGGPPRDEHHLAASASPASRWGPASSRSRWAFWWPRRDRLGAAGHRRTLGPPGPRLLLSPGQPGTDRAGMAVLALASPSAEPPLPTRDPGEGRLVWSLAIAFLPLVPLGLMYLGTLASRGADATTMAQPPRSAHAGRLEEPVDLGRPDDPGARTPCRSPIASATAFVVLAPVVWLAARPSDLGGGEGRGAAMRGRSAPKTPDDRRPSRLVAAGDRLDRRRRRRARHDGPRARQLPAAADRPVRAGRAGGRHRDRPAAAGWPARRRRAWRRRLILQSAIVWDYALVFRPHRRRDRPGPRRRRPRTAAGVLAGIGPQPVPRQPAVACRQLAGGRQRQHRLGQLRDPALLLPGAVPPRARSSPAGRTRGHLRLDDPADAGLRARGWQELLDRNADAIDVLVDLRQRAGARRRLRTVVPGGRATGERPHPRPRPGGTRWEANLTATRRAPPRGACPRDRARRGLDDFASSFFSTLSFSLAFSFFSSKTYDSPSSLELLGPLLAGDGDAQDQLLALELVDALGGLALGVLGAVVDGEVEGRRLGLGIGLDLAGVIRPVDGRLERLPVEGPATTRRLLRDPGPFQGLEGVSRGLIFGQAPVAPAHRTRAAPLATVRKAARPAAIARRRARIANAMEIVLQVRNSEEHRRRSPFRLLGRSLRRRRYRTGRTRRPGTGLNHLPNRAARGPTRLPPPAGPTEKHSSRSEKITESPGSGPVSTAPQ